MSTHDPLPIEPDEGLIEAIRAQRLKPETKHPNTALFLFECDDPETLRRCIARIPKPLDEWLEEVVVVPRRPASHQLLEARDLAAGRPLTVRIHRNPREYGYGGARKAAFEYALLAGFDHVVAMRGDETHPPERLVDLLYAALVEGRSPVFAARPGRQGALADSMASTFQNRALGMRLCDHGSGYRLYSRLDLERIPFQLNSDDRRFDTEITIQHRALGIAIHELAMPAGWPERPTGRAGVAQLASACATAVDYRLHQLHASRRGRYFVDLGAFYTLKHSPTGSHMQIVEAIPPGSRVLDLGCSQGLLAGPLRDKDVHVVGVDVERSDRLAAELDEFFERDLEQPLELPTGRVFDCVLVSDVIEHVRNRTQLLRGARRYLKQGGRLIISTPNVALWFYRLSLLIGRFEYGPRGALDETHVHLYTRSTFRREVERAGFHVLRERFTSLPFEVVFESTGRSRLLRWVSRAYQLLARAWPEMFAYQILLEAEITTFDEEATSSRAPS